MGGKIMRTKVGFDFDYSPNSLHTTGDADEMFPEEIARHLHGIAVVEFSWELTHSDIAICTAAKVESLLAIVS